MKHDQTTSEVEEMETATDLRNDEAAKCKCISCAACKGRGWIYGRDYLDDPDGDQERCPDCGGDGLTEVCAYCRGKEEDEYDKHDAL